MNRKQRRAAIKQRPLASGRTATSASDPIEPLFAQAAHLQRQNKLDDAARAYKRVLVLKPNHAEACNNLGVVLLAQGKLSEASTQFARALSLMPNLFDQFHGVCMTLVAVAPPIGEAMKKAAAAWPTRPSLEQLLGDGGLGAIAAEPMLLCLLQSTPARDVALERLLTAVRMALLAGLDEKLANAATIAFVSAMARQCFINEYVFATTPDEDARVERLKVSIGDALAAGASVPPLWTASLAMYQPLHALPNAEALLDRTWPAAVDDVLNQQLREPRQERELRQTIPRLTPIEDDVSQRVRKQYEENPYPRWVDITCDFEPVAIDWVLRQMFPAAAFAPLGKTEDIEVLVAGSGTGRHAIWLAQRFAGVRLLAVDLSLSSLCFAKRKTPAAIAERITYAQGDILKLGTLDRNFDVVDASGVLHHMADPLEGWRILLSLLRPGGFMHVALYSDIARRDVVATRTFISERGYASTAEDIRRCRQDLLDMPLRAISRFNDFFSMSECRDLLFNVQEGRMTIPQIKAFIAEHALKFIGFVFERSVMHSFKMQFAQNGWSLSDLDRWHEMETNNPDLFSGMYQLWLQKS